MAMVRSVPLELLVMQVQRVGADRVQEVTCVRDHDQRVIPSLEVLLQPDHGVEVKVVGRLVNCKRSSS